MKPLTRNELFDYHVRKIILDTLWDEDVRDIQSADELETKLAENARELGNQFLDRIIEYFGLDEVLAMIQAVE